MEEKKFIEVRKDEYNIKQFVKRMFGKGKISKVRIEYTPVGEKIIISTHKPGWIIGKRGEKIAELTEILKKKFKMENPHVDIEEILHPEFDAQLVADDIALTLERFGAMKYKASSYRMLGKIKKGGALGAELRVSGKLPSDRARSWRFAFGYLKKTGDAAKVVDRAESVAQTKQGVVGIKVAILAPGVIVHDQITVDEEFMKQVISNASIEEVEETVKIVKKKRKVAPKKKVSKKEVLVEKEKKVEKVEEIEKIEKIKETKK
ncbi:MAG: 30S ribosomal protein S3 [Nanoarchaeota archaeon]|nr:30S ribosomal protein S3 [Nanoarchaeota archaeon]